MNFDINAAVHACNVLRRNVEVEYPYLDVIFIIHRKGEAKKTLKSSINQFKETPSISPFIPLMARYDETKFGVGHFLGIVQSRSGGLFSFFGPKRSSAVFIVNFDFFDNVDEIRQHGLACVWHALKTIEEFKSGSDTNIVVRQKVIAPKLKPTEVSFNNMLADAFAAITLEKTGHTAAIKKLAKRRSMLALSTHLGYKAEEYPFPIALDASQIIHDEYTPIPQLRGRPMQQAYDMTVEIAETFEESNIRQWWVFSRSAQEMAWMNVEPHKILSCAIYTSEDPYVRATGYIVAEAVSIDPTPLTEIDFYNAFTDQEVNERNHFRVCEESFQILAAKVIADNDSIYFKKAAIDQNKALLHGKLLGWCAYALLKAAEAYEEAEDAKESMENAQEIFDESFKGIPWDGLIEFNNLIIRERIDGQEITMDTLLRLAEHDETFYKLYAAFDLSIKKSKELKGLGSGPNEPTLQEYLKDSDKKKMDIELQNKNTNLKLEEE